MAILMANPLIKNLRGTIGGIVFRQVGKKIVASKKPSVPKKESLWQRNNRQKFADASAYARRAMNDPQKEAYYQHKAKKLGLPNAYTAAITHYMRKGVVSEVDMRSYNGKAGSIVNIRAHKGSFYREQREGGL